MVAYYRCKRNAYDAGDGTAYSYDATLAQFEDVVKLTERTKYGASLSSSMSSSLSSSSWLGSSTLTSSSSNSGGDSKNNDSNSENSLESNFPSGYPHDAYFSRFPMPKRALSLAIGKLRSDDMYNCCSEYYPDPDHRSIALSQQRLVGFHLVFSRKR